MPIHMDIVQHADLIIRQVVGELSAEDVVENVGQTYADPRFRPGMHVLWDLSQGTAQGLSAKQLRELGQFARAQAVSRGERYRMAILTAETVDFGLGRQYEALTGDHFCTIRVFKLRPPAMAWLAGEMLD